VLGRGSASQSGFTILGSVGTALFGAGYPSDTNFTTACDPELYVAVTKQARQTGRLTDGAGFHDLGTSAAHVTAEVPRS
jgi:hypothetical protein